MNMLDKVFAQLILGNPHGASVVTKITAEALVFLFGLGSILVGAALCPITGPLLIPIAAHTTAAAQSEAMIPTNITRRAANETDV